MSSSYHRPGYDDLTLPPIRDPSYASASRTRSNSRHVTTLEPPTHTSSTYPRSGSAVPLPPLRHPERSGSSYTHNSNQTYHSLPPLTASTSRRSSQRDYLPPVSTSHRSSTSHHRSDSFSEDYESPSSSRYHYSSQSPPSGHFTPGYSPPSTQSPTTSRAFACDICGTSFSRAYDCKRHRDIHTRQGGHECPYCHKTLSRADALKRHMERGCAGMPEDDVEEIDGEQERRDRRDRRSSMGAPDTTSKYYYSSSSSSRQRSLLQ